MILTATATQEVKNEFLKILHNPIQEITRVNKGNISLHVKELKIVPKKGKNTFVVHGNIQVCQHTTLCECNDDHANNK